METFATNDLATRYALLLRVLFATRILTNSAPGGVEPHERLIMVVAFPRLCHALLFVSDLTVDVRSPLLAQDTHLWVQVTNTRVSNTQMQETETSIVNPLPFMRKHNICLVQRQYEPLSVLNALASEWGKQLRMQNVTVPSARDKPYVESLGDMSLYEACLCLCLEFAEKAGWIKVLQRVAGSLRPFCWRVLDEEALRTLFPRYFYEPSSFHTWTTRLCIMCHPSSERRFENISNAVLRAGYDYIDLRFVVNYPLYFDWANELNCFIKLPS
jgi:hypothetical protein